MPYNHAQVFCAFMAREVWGDHAVPAPGGGMSVYASGYYDEWSDAHASAVRVGAVPARSATESERADLGKQGTLFVFPDGSELVVSDDGNAVGRPSGGDPDDQCRAIVLDAPAYAEMIAAREPFREFQDESLAVAGGGRIVRVGPDTLGRVCALMVRDETPSDTLLRVAHSIGGRPLN